MVGLNGGESHRCAGIGGSGGVPIDRAVHVPAFDLIIGVRHCGEGNGCVLKDSGAACEGRSVLYRRDAAVVPDSVGDDEVIDVDIVRRDDVGAHAIGNIFTHSCCPVIITRGRAFDPAVMAGRQPPAREKEHWAAVVKAVRKPDWETLKELLSGS